MWVANQLGLKKYTGGKKDSWWKRRIEGDIKHLKKDINILERVKKDQIGACKESKAKLIVEKYREKRKGITPVIDELKQRDPRRNKRNTCLDNVWTNSTMPKGFLHAWHC